MSFKDRHLTGVSFLDISFKKRILNILLSILTGLNYGSSFERGKGYIRRLPREHEPVPDSRQFNRPVPARAIALVKPTRSCTMG